MPEILLFVIGVFVFLINLYAILSVGYFESKDVAHAVPPARRKGPATADVIGKQPLPTDA